MEITINDVKQFIEENKEDEGVSNYIGGFVTADRVNKYLETDDGKKLLQPMLDKYHTKGLETWKTNNLEKLIDAEIKKRFPEKDPKDIELEKIKAELAKIQTEKQRETLTNKAIKIANEKKIPLDLVDYFISDNEEKTVSNLAKLEEVFNSHAQKIVEERLKGGSYTPPDDKNNPKADYEKMSMEEYAKQWQQNKK